MFILSLLPDEESDFGLSVSESPEDKGDRESQPSSPAGVTNGAGGSEHGFGNLTGSTSFKSWFV